jgi:hypothetical protein
MSDHGDMEIALVGDRQGVDVGCQKGAALMSVARLCDLWIDHAVGYVYRSPNSQAAPFTNPCSAS